MFFIIISLVILLINHQAVFVEHFRIPGFTAHSIIGNLQCGISFLSYFSNTVWVNTLCPEMN